MLENLDEVCSSRINLELPGLELEYFDEAVTNSVEDEQLGNQASLHLTRYKSWTVSIMKGNTIQSGKITRIHLHITLDSDVQHDIPLKYLLKV